MLAAFLTASTTVFGQTRIDGDFPFQSDPAKKYSIYIPSGYVQGTPHRLMLGLHPFNTNRWDAESWCDTLIVFAETNDLILVCPDGGADGQVDDPIDTAFTSALLDSMQLWYTIDAAKTYVMGFSWGGKTTYTYGLSHHTKFGGFLPIGSAMSGTAEVSSVMQNVAGKPVYIVHGGSDTPASRLFPIRDSLISNGAILDYNLMTGVNHTIDFPNRNDILTVAYQWIDSVNCAQMTGVSIVEAIKGNDQLLNIYPTILSSANDLNIEYLLENEGMLSIKLYDLTGKFIEVFNLAGVQGENRFQLQLPNLSAGTYVLEFQSELNRSTQKIILN